MSAVRAGDGLSLDRAVQRWLVLGVVPILLLALVWSLALGVDPPSQPPTGPADPARQLAWLAEKAPAEIDRAVQIFAHPVRLPARLPPGAVLAHAVAYADSTTYGTVSHSLDVSFRLPSGQSLHIWQTDDPTGLASEGKDPVLNPEGRPIAIGSMIWTRTDLQNSPGRSEFSSRFEDGVTLSIAFPVSQVDFEALLSSVIAVQRS